MTSLIERLRAEREIWKGGPFVIGQPLGDHIITALEQARELVEILDSPFYGKNQDAARAWLRLIDGEQAKEERHDR